MQMQTGMVIWGDAEKLTPNRGVLSVAKARVPFLALLFVRSIMTMAFQVARTCCPRCFMAVSTTSCSKAQAQVVYPRGLLAPRYQKTTHSLNTCQVTISYIITENLRALNWPTDSQSDDLQGPLDLTGKVSREGKYPCAHGGFADVWKGVWRDVIGQRKVMEAESTYPSLSLNSYL